MTPFRITHDRIDQAALVSAPQFGRNRFGIVDDEIVLQIFRVVGTDSVSIRKPCRDEVFTITLAPADVSIWKFIHHLTNPSARRSRLYFGNKFSCGIDAAKCSKRRSGKASCSAPD
jgi:hypothetical protein